MTPELTPEEKDDISEMLWTALTIGNTDKARELLNNPLYAFLIHANDREGWGVLHYAIYHQEHEFIADIIEQGADIEKRVTIRDGHPFQGATPLHFAAKDGTMSVVKQLIEAGADIHSKMESGSSVIDMAEQHPEIVAYLKEVQLVLQDKEQLDHALQPQPSIGAKKLSKAL